MIYFTSDTHFGHENIIAYCKRPFPDKYTMNQEMITRWNKRVLPEDTVYFLGDFAFMGGKETADVAYALHGVKHWILGNHDKGSSANAHVRRAFQSVQDYLEIKPNVAYQDDEGNPREIGMPIVLCHFPFATWNGKGYGSLHLHGHCHGTFPIDKSLRMDVGVDTHDFYPWSLEEIRDSIAMKTIG